VFYLFTGFEKTRFSLTLVTISTSAKITKIKRVLSSITPHIAPIESKVCELRMVCGLLD
jgi:hypothetical protein